MTLRKHLETALKLALEQEDHHTAQLLQTAIEYRDAFHPDDRGEALA